MFMELKRCRVIFLVIKGWNLICLCLLFFVYLAVNAARILIFVSIYDLCAFFVVDMHVCFHLFTSNDFCPFILMIPHAIC
jgi:hypothetical protein